MAESQGLDRIREAVLTQADARVEQIQARTSHEIERIEREAERQVRHIIEEAEAAASQQHEAQTLRTQSMARLDERRVQLTARQNLIAEVVAEALRRLKEAPEAEKMSIYRQLLPARPRKGTVAVPAQGERELLRRVVAEAGLSERVQVAEGEGAFAGGFQLKDGPVTDNLSFDQLFELQADDLRQTAARVLFRAGQEEEG